MTRQPKQIAFDICNGDNKARLELEKAIGKPLKDMTDSEKFVGLACLSAFEKQWNK